MASNTQGIQQLLAAEKKAAEKVAEARKRKIINFFYPKFLHEKFHDTGNTESHDDGDEFLGLFFQARLVV